MKRAVYGSVLIAGLLVLAAAAPVFAESEFMKEFKGNYGRLDLDLLNNPCEIADIANFVYQKDIATFTFTEGKLFMLRHVFDRPTTAVFIGKGHATIAPPAIPMERANLAWASGDTAVNEDFDICFIRFGDDFDLEAKKPATFDLSTLDFKYYTQTMQSQGEFFFRPRIFHTYDHYFQLLRSCYERGPDGYFWIDFNRTSFSFDPNRPEQTLIGYEKYGGDFSTVDAVLMQRRENNITTNVGMSRVPYPTTLIDIDATVEMGGLDAKKMEGCETTVRVLVNADSLRFVSMFLNYNLKEDSIYYNGAPVDYYRRKDFSFIGVILPEYAYAGDTLTFTLWYRGKDFLHAFPFVENPAPTPHRLHFRVPRDYTYLMPGKGPTGRDGRYDTFTVVTDQPYWRFSYQGYVSGYESIPLTTAMGVTIDLLKSKAVKKQQECFIPDDQLRAAVTGSFDYATGILGPPRGIFALTVFPDSNLSMPGLVNIPQLYCYTAGMGGIQMKAAQQMSRQWFGATLKPLSEREYWLADAVPDYFGLMYAQKAVGPDAFYSELEDRRRKILTVRDKDGDQPLALGNRVNPVLRAYKGSWMLHMLRFAMIDLATSSENAFNRFLAELSMRSTMQSFSNADVMTLAEKHYGQPLDWFFNHWLFDRGIPQYQVTYAIAQRDDGWYVSGAVETKDVSPDYRMPVIMRVESVDRQSVFYRQSLAAPRDTFELGPMEREPKELFFNEFFSVLCNSSVKKQ